MKEPMNTTKTELLEEFEEEFGYLVLSKSGLPYCDVKYIRDRDKRIKQHFNKALDRYRDIVVEEEKDRIIEILKRLYEGNDAPRTNGEIIDIINGEFIEPWRKQLKQTNNNTTKEICKK